MAKRATDPAVIHPGERIGRYLAARGAPPQEAIAQRAGISRPRLNEILNGVRPITVDSALRLERLLPAFAAEELLRAQAEWDLAAARRETRKMREVEKIEPLELEEGEERERETGGGAGLFAALRDSEEGPEELLEGLEAFLAERDLLAEARRFTRSRRLHQQALTVLRPHAESPVELRRKATRLPGKRTR